MFCACLRKTDAAGVHFPKQANDFAKPTVKRGERRLPREKANIDRQYYATKGERSALFAIPMAVSAERSTMKRGNGETAFPVILRKTNSQQENVLVEFLLHKSNAVGKHRYTLQLLLARLLLVTNKTGKLELHSVQALQVLTAKTDQPRNLVLNSPLHTHIQIERIHRSLQLATHSLQPVGEHRRHRGARRVGAVESGV